MCTNNIGMLNNLTHGFLDHCIYQFIHVYTIFLKEVHTSSSVASSSSLSPDAMKSTCSCTSAPSSPPAVRGETGSRRGSILPLQNPFAVTGDEDCQEPDESQMPPENLIAQCPELTLTLDGTTEATSFKSLRRESAIELDAYECTSTWLLELSKLLHLTLFCIY